MKRLLCLLLLLCLLMTACELPEPPVHQVPEGSQGLTVHFLDVGQADCTLLLCDGDAMLIDGGNVSDSQLVVSYLNSQGVTELDYAVATHPHEDHIGGLTGALARFGAENIWCPVTDYDSSYFEDFARYAGTWTCPEPGSTYPLGGAEITVLGPVKTYENINDLSIILRVDYGSTSFLFTGDAETQAEQDVLDAGARVSATVLKAGHHGSNTSSGYQWLRAVTPDYAVISCGLNNEYGHPHEEPMSRLRDADVAVYRTDLQGHIICESDGVQVAFTTEKQDTEADDEAAVSYIGNIRSGIFHLSICSGLPAEKNRILFETYDEAVGAGYVPCRTCMKK